ncbi:MAG: 4Fe-4S dicluster domain-containing protein, partial [candidate division Zixibacteria bacterium]|nr:4Fe-4S dicluster domain-containing protein [candidate division Zixibacteria bacterium]
EEWGDRRSVDGTLSVIQPLIEPLHGGHSALEMAQIISTAQETSGHELVRRTWKSYLRGVNFEKKWEVVLHDGVLAGETSSSASISAKNKAISSALISQMSKKNSSSGLELAFVSSNMYDGRYANNGWLQELPDPVTKLTWDNAVILNQKTAQALNVEKEELVTLEVNGVTVEAPIWIVPGLADNTISLALGYGRTECGVTGSGVGANAFALRPGLTDYYIAGASVRKTGRTYKLACSQDHWSLEGRPVYREATLDEYKKNGNFAAEVVETPELSSLWTEHKYEEGYQWGMAIDLNSCTGCNACTIACVSENNISVVGKEQVSKGREMHWIRIDRFFSDDPENPQMVNQPMTCMHCEMAPCEEVCPVAATVHDSEGLNVMVYNRCIGTRYCSNNCPYKVRRFNFFNYTKDMPETVKMAMNPDVTIRSRGVMEKCTYCTQRIERAKTQAKQDNNRQVKDGEIVTACQQACPAQAITFGNINDPNSEVSRIKKQNRNYLALAELNTRPRTSYLAGLRNPNPALPLSHG